jgi:acyl carrier protein
MKNIQTIPDTVISSKIKEIISHKLGLDQNEIMDTDSFADDLAVDSLDVLEILMEIEKEFSIKIPDEDAGKLKTVDSVIYYVMNRTS